MKNIWRYRTAALVLLVLPFIAVSQELQVMSYNIRFDNPADGENAWGNRKAHLVSQIAYHAPDLVGTQEGLAHQLADIASGLPQYAYFGKGRDAGENEGEYSAIFYRTDRLELLSEGTFWLSQTPEIPSRGWDAALNRICTYGFFRHRASGRRFLMFNTHFDHIGQEARRESVQLIRSKIKEINREGFPVILTGDLNLEPETEPIQILSGSMTDAFMAAGAAAYGPAGTFNGFDCTSPATRRIDYIFISGDRLSVSRFATLSETREKGYPSDHFPVLATLVLLP
ncbi:endonuclease/exonuclease/phosphatase family protein [Robiginitalea sediminis]|uniref:endonuclease/exonuclease/phosphatase family protein n=1 Tax=Robiginitalea sediminis TaxID=1982593 RepID=UPI001E5E9139|nr:endonuclease/exonuclease/phosphatase family protein [Robiginitalea sediminis]